MIANVGGVLTSDALVQVTCMAIVLTLDSVRTLCHCSSLLLLGSRAVVDTPVASVHRLDIEEVRLRCCPSGGLAHSPCGGCWEHGEIC